VSTDLCETSRQRSGSSKGGRSTGVRNVLLKKESQPDLSPLFLHRPRTPSRQRRRPRALPLGPSNKPSNIPSHFGLPRKALSSAKANWAKSTRSDVGALLVGDVRNVESVARWEGEAMRRSLAPRFLGNAGRT
jgi:hypothetical protein